jgi:hypothetical protein
MNSDLLAMAYVLPEFDMDAAFETKTNNDIILHINSKQTTVKTLQSLPIELTLS